MLRMARVMKVYPESRTADLLLLDGAGGPLLRVPILGASGGDTGAFDTPPVEHSGDTTMSGPREMLAVVAPLNINAFVIVGFLPPPKREGLFADGRMVYRHQSDTYFTIDKDGNAELRHPSGTFIRLGTPGSEDLSGKDKDGTWQIKRNTGAAPTVTIGTAAGGASKSTITIGPDGALSISTQGTVSMQSVGAMTLKAPGMTLDAPVTVTGTLSAAGGITGGDGATITGTLRATEVIATAEDVHLNTHRHKGVTPGGGESQDPVEGS